MVTSVTSIIIINADDKNNKQNKNRAFLYFVLAFVRSNAERETFFSLCYFCRRQYLIMIVTDVTNPKNPFLIVNAKLQLTSLSSTSELPELGKTFLDK